MTTASERSLELLVFELAGARYGVPAAAVREVQRAVALTPLPESLPPIEGGMNLRGELVPVIDARSALGSDAKPLEASDHLIVVNVRDRNTALRVDRATELSRVGESDVTAASGRFVTRVARLPEGFVFLVDLERLVTT